MILPTILSAVAYLAALVATVAVYFAVFGFAMGVWAAIAGLETFPELHLAILAPTFIAGALYPWLLRRFDQAWGRFADWWTL